jgi:hypothetical protein
MSALPACSCRCGGWRGHVGAACVFMPVWGVAWAEVCACTCTLPYDPALSPPRAFFVVCPCANVIVCMPINRCSPDSFCFPPTRFQGVVGYEAIMKERRELEEFHRDLAVRPNAPPRPPAPRQHGGTPVPLVNPCVACLLGGRHGPLCARVFLVRAVGHLGTVGVRGRRRAASCSGLCGREQQYAKWSGRQLRSARNMWCALRAACARPGAASWWRRGLRSRPASPRCPATTLAWAATSWQLTPLPSSPWAL